MQNHQISSIRSPKLQVLVGSQRLALQQTSFVTFSMKLFTPTSSIIANMLRKTFLLQKLTILSQKHDAADMNYGDDLESDDVTIESELGPQPPCVNSREIVRCFLAIVPTVKTKS